ncbi:MAG: GAF domain-containing protein [Acholeplasmataceae bacterium]
MNYNELLKTAETLFEDQPNRISLLSNASAFLNEVLDQMNWIGFYLYDGNKLTVGPFQGRVACATIELGMGVCGEAAMKKQTMYVSDVLNHSNHIACDANSRSEVVVPMYINNALFGVLDIDSPILNRFDEALITFLENITQILLKQLTFNTL